ncbi:tRNA-dihydrouridine synthase [Candidatus Saccharibacteria bacterium]|nr:tRNA-dihydrouridine synthase [Candidatus Saccharibacteria bacterium]
MNKTNLLDKLPKPIFILAPMDDVTDTVFRQIVADCAPPDLYITEFVNVDGLQSPGREKLLKKLRFTSKETPIFAQLWGLKPENFYKTVKEIVDGTLIEEIQSLRAKDRDAMQGRSTLREEPSGPSTVSSGRIGSDSKRRSEARNETYKEVRRASTGASDIAVRSKHGSMPGFAGQQADAVLSYAGVDLNMGCPVKTVIKNGACAALINNRQLAGEIIDATQEAVEYVFSRGAHLGAAQGGGKDRRGNVRDGTLSANRSPQHSDAPEATGGVGGFADEQARAVRVPRDFPISVKTRVGFSTTDMSWLEFLLSKKLDLLSIHGRTAKQLSKVPADWELIGQVREMRDVLCPTTKIVGNGDVMTRQQGLELAKKYKLDGVMIGRGVFHDPFVFAPPVGGPAAGSPWEQWSKEQKIELFGKHIKLFAQTWKRGDPPAGGKFETLKKFAKVYINGFDGASELRAELMSASSARELLGFLDKEH